METSRCSEPPSSLRRRVSQRTNASRSSSLRSAPASTVSRTGLKARPEGRVLLEPVQDDVHVVPAHRTLHSMAARSMRPISPKKRTAACAGLTAPISTIQFSSSCEPLSCSSFVVSAQSAS